MHCHGLDMAPTKRKSAWLFHFRYRGLFEICFTATGGRVYACACGRIQLGITSWRTDRDSAGSKEFCVCLPNPSVAASRSAWSTGALCAGSYSYQLSAKGFIAAAGGFAGTERVVRVPGHVSSHLRLQRPASSFPGLVWPFCAEAAV